MNASRRLTRQMVQEEQTLIRIQPPVLGLSQQAEPILRSLPQWFGIEEATQMYVRDVAANPT